MVLRTDAAGSAGIPQNGQPQATQKVVHPLRVQLQADQERDADNLYENAPQAYSNATWREHVMNYETIDETISCQPKIVNEPRRRAINVGR